MQNSIGEEKIVAASSEIHKGKCNAWNNRIISKL